MTGYDPLPDLAALIDGLQAIAAGAAGEDAANARVIIALGGLLAGPYAALRGGLLLDEPGREHPGREHPGTEDALREAVRPA